MADQNAKITHEKLKNTTKSEVIEIINYHLSGLTPNQSNSLIAQMYRDELVRRSQDKVNQSMLDYTQEVHRFTKQMRNMTVIILFSTIFGVALTAYQVFCK